MPTCEADGYIVRTCTGGDSEVTVTLEQILADAEGENIFADLLAANEITDPATQLAKTGHDYKFTYVKPTCTANGYFTYVCARNKEETGTVTMEQIAADFALPEAERLYTPICNANGITAASDMAMTGHSGEEAGRWITVVDEGANICVDGGQKLLVCANCMEYVYKAEAIEAKGHVVTAEWKVTVAPTLTEKGEIMGACSVCGLSAATVEIPALNKTDYAYSVSKEASCTETGIDVYTKTIGGLDLRFEVVTSAAHNVGGVSMPLDKVYSQQEMEALGAKGGVSGNYPATCLDESGLGYFYCDECGELYIVHVSGPHTYTDDDLIDEKAPSCYETGYKKYECSVCGEEVMITLPKTEHTYGQPSVSGNEEDGYTITLTCSVCPEGTAGHTKTIEALTWQKDEGASKEATCQAAGQNVFNYTYKETEDGDIQNGTYTEVLPQLAHKSVHGGEYVVGQSNDKIYNASLVDEVSGNYPADCTTVGQGILRCQYCDTVFIVMVTGDHKWGEPVVTKPTCEEEGFITYTCTLDAAHTMVIKQADIDAADPEAKAEYEAVLAEAGLTSLKATGHNWGEPVITGEGTDKVTLTFTCKNDATHQEVIECTEFTKGEETPSTCETKGHVTYTYKYTDPNNQEQTGEFTVELPLALHKNSKGTAYDPAKAVYFASEVDEVSGNYPATCLETGLGTIRCATCGYVAIVTVQGDHTYTTEDWQTKAPTCTEGGYQYKHCSVCDKDIIKDGSATNPLGHSYTYAVTTAATTTTAGVLTGTCSVCGDTVTIALPAISTENGYTVVGEPVAPTCQSEGYTEYQYVVKEGENTIFTYTVRVTTPAVDHNLEQGHVYTWEFNGYTYTGTYCNLCGQIIVTNKTPIETPEVGA